MRNNPRPQEIYRHFKGNLYQICTLAKHSETGEMMVVYQALYDDFQVYVRPLAMFMEEVDRTKYPEVSQKYRFELRSAAAAEEKQKTEADAMGKPEEAWETQLQEDWKIQNKSQQNVPESFALEQEEQEELNIDPLVLEFLDADSYERKLEILSTLHCRIDHEMINIMAVAVDIEVKEGDIEERYEELKNCLLTFEKYECNRLR